VTIILLTLIILSRVWRLYKTGFGMTTAFIGSQYTLYNSLQCTSLSSLGRVSSRLGPGPPADPTIYWLTAKLLLGLASTVILGSESHRTHDQILLPDGSGSLQTLLSLYSLGSDSKGNDSSYCCLPSRYQVTSTPQAYGVYVTIYWFAR
jgi:hypothetical protein